MDIKRIRKVILITTNMVSKINQMQEIVPDYGKVRYEDRNIANIFSLTNLVKKKGVTYESHQ